MAADVFGTYLVLSMGLFTVASIIIGYFLLNSAVINAARSSAYYAYIRIAEGLSSSIKSSSSSITNINIYPKYLIFSAYFRSENQIYYNTPDGLKVFFYGIPRNDIDMFTDIKNSIQSSYSNEGMPSRQELKKCVGQPCLCFAELDVELNLAPDYFKPLACIDICWGENVAEYNTEINYADFSEEVKTIVNKLNNQMPFYNSKCKACRDYVNSINYKLLQSKDYSVLVTDFDPHLSNKLNLDRLADFSEKTKFSFLTNIIECKSFNELIDSSGKSMDSLVFVFNNLTDNGTFALMNANYNTIFKLISFDYNNNDQPINPTISYTMNSLIKSEKLKNDIIFGGQ
ncbi:MAG: hypothetical protein WC376_04655 [Candidatus Nanoarchaeia archaeon]|jgi:hypothetical protein